MKVSPYDIRYATVGRKRKDGKHTVSIITSGHPTRADAEAKKGDRDHVVAYVATYRRHYGEAYAQTPRPAKGHSIMSKVT